MRNNSFIFILLILCIGLVCGLTMWFGYSSQDQMWRLDDTYSQELATWRASSQFTSATYSSSYSNDGLAVSMPSRSFRSARAHVPSYAYAPTTPATSSSSLMSNGASPAGGGLYTTSSAAMRSFGDGSSSSMGSSRSSAGAGAAAAAGGVYTSMPSAGSSSWGGGGSSSSSGAYASSFVMNSAQSANPANAIAMGSSAGPNSLYSGFAYTSMLDQYRMASYGNTGMNRISGRQNLSSMGGSGDNDNFTYDAWLLWMQQLGYRFGTPGDGNSYTFTTEQAYQAFLIWYKSKTGKDYEEGASQFSYEEWCKWYMTNNGTHTSQNGSTFTFFQTPVGDVLPLLIIVLMYVVFMACRHYRKRIATSLENTDKTIN